MARRYLFCGPSQDQEYQRARLLFFRPFPTHDGPRYAADLARILGCSSSPYVNRHERDWFLQGSFQVHFWKYQRYPQSGSVYRRTGTHLDFYK